jgi:hypothetical protein
MSYAVTGVSPRRNLEFLTSTERRMLDTSELERKARARLADIARRMHVRLPQAPSSPATPKPLLHLHTATGSRPITRRAAAGMLRAARLLQERRIGYSVAYNHRAGIVRGEGPQGEWQLEHARGAA